MLKYRADIDGMRAIAVLAVVFCHAHFAGFAGGFLGVDIFFVISGFLITNILIRSETVPYDGLSRATVKLFLLEFYERRVRRIVPALSVVLLTSVVVALLLLSPYELRDFANSLIASTAFAANLFFMAGTDYWAPRYETPLLHLWSLGVEEQFYIFYPLLLAWLGTHRPKRFLIPFLMGALLLSLLLSEVFARELLPKGYEFWFPGARGWAKLAAFYFTGTRGWELLLGALVALQLDRDGGVRLPGGQIVREGLALVAFAAMVWPIFVVGADTVWPGINAFVPCAGAAVLIYLHADSKTWVSHLLGLPVMVGVGLISYSLYLWHWPVFEFYHRWVLRLPTAGEYAVLIMLAMVLAWASWRFIERPFRRRSGYSRRTMFRLAGGAGGVLVLLAVVILVGRGLPQRFFGPESAVYAILDGKGPQPRQALSDRAANSCYVRNHAPRYSFERCFIPAKDQPNVVLWGDSLAGTYYPGFYQQASVTGIHLISANHFDCRPVLDSSLVPPVCAAFNRSVLAHMDKRIDAVILSARFFANRDLLPALRKTVQTLTARGVRVIVLGPALEYREAEPFFVARYVETGNAHWIDSNFAMKPDFVAFDREMGRSLSGIAGVHYLSVYGAVCRGGHCPMMTDGTAVQTDYAHLTAQGSLLFGARLWPAIATIVKAPKR